MKTLPWMPSLLMMWCLSACQPAFTVKAASGKAVTLTKRWDRGCVPGAAFSPDAPAGVWVRDQRTITGITLVTTLLEYHNGSATTPNCTDGLANTTTFTQVLSADEKQVNITWVDLTGTPAAAPRGLEGVTKAAGATGLMTKATRTPNSEAGASDLNAQSFCGVKGWANGVAKDVLDCFTGGVNPAKGTLVVDDRGSTWKVYDGFAAPGTDPSAYPTLMPNALPHEGPFDP